MPRPIQEKLLDIAWWGEQVAHAFAASVVALPFAALFLIVRDPLFLIAGQLAAGLAGGVREILQNWRDDPSTNDITDSHFDSVAFQIGGAVSMSLVYIYA
jgi:hypothetical protein